MSNPEKTGFLNMPFAKKAKLRLWVSVVITAVGFILFTATWLGIFGDRINDEFTSGAYSGLGGGLMGAGIVTVIKYKRVLRDPARFKTAEIEDTDERTGFIMGKTYAATFYIGTAVTFITAFVAAIYNPTVAKTLISVLGVYGVALMISYFVIKKRY